MARFCNLFGPTETNVCTWYDVPRPEDSILRRRSRSAEPSTASSVRRHGRRQTVAPGDVGELLGDRADGDAGLLGDADRTAHVSRSPLAQRPTSTARATWSAASRREPSFLGRRDLQIKSRGYRIELGDIEAAINAHPAVVECAVVPVPDELFTNTLLAYVVAGESLRPT